MVVVEVEVEEEEAAAGEEWVSIKCLADKKSYHHQKYRKKKPTNNCIYVFFICHTVNSTMNKCKLGKNGEEALRNQQSL